MLRRTPSLAILCLVPALAAALPSQADDPSSGPIAAALADQSEDVRVYNEHLVILASRFMEGRVPGSRGMQTAKEYCQFWLEKAGLEPPFTSEDGQPSFRQPFPLAGTAVLKSQSLALADGPALEADQEYTAMSLGASGSVAGPLVYVGYSIESGPEGYASYAEDDDLTGKIALMMRFEPMDEEGQSLWADQAWSRHAGFNVKLEAAVKRGAAGVVIVNTPGANDPRAAHLVSFSGGGTGAVDVPVFMVTAEGAQRLLDAGGVDRSLMDLRRQADAGRAVADLGLEVELACEIEQQDFVAENVGGLLRGRGDLADQLIVMGAHLDHLGMGFFGSRDPDLAGRALHPGADDNASGSAALLMLAQKLADRYAALPPDQPRRSILFLCFSGEESGLNGSRYYVEHPIVPLEHHALMMNFDMIGRIVNNRFSVSGVQTAKGMADWVQPILDASPLEIVSRPGGGGGSDHMAFEARGVPVLFGIIADFHADYHTPRDTSDKINRVGAVEAMHLWRDIALAAAEVPQPFEFVAQSSGQPQTRLSGIKVRFGIMPGSYDEESGGVLVGGVTPGGSAEAGGVQKGDLIVTWNGDDVLDVQSWMGLLAQHEPGDVVQVGVLRDGEEKTLSVKLQAR